MIDRSIYIMVLETKISDLTVRIRDLRMIHAAIENDASWYEYQIENMKTDSRYSTIERIWYTRSAKSYRHEARFNMGEITYYEGLLLDAQNDKYLYEDWEERIV